MKALITIGAAIVFSMAVAVLADDLSKPPMRDLGIEYYETSPARTTAMVSVPFRAAAPELQDLGIALYESHLARESELASLGKAGEAGGGVGAVEPVDERARIWETIFPIGGSDLP